LRAYIASETRRPDSPLAGTDDEAFAYALANEAARILRDCLVTTLVTDYDLTSIVAEACAWAGAVGSEAQVAYCLVVLCQKADPPRSSKGGPRLRTYRLDVGDESFPAQLRFWAETIAGNLVAWGKMYETIHAEADRYVTASLRELVRIDRRDDVVRALADKISGYVGEGERLADMSLDRARAVPPIGREYVFQSLLPHWVARIARRKVSHQAASLAGREEVVVADDDADTPLDECVELANEMREDFHRALVRHIARLRGSRGLLRAAIDRASDLDAQLARLRTANPDDEALILRMRAALLHVADGLGEEQRSLAGMLAYIVLAMSKAEKRQRVAILSLRDEVLERVVIDHIATRMRAVVGDDNPPSPGLIRKTTVAAVPDNRRKELERLRDDHRFRRSRFVALRSLLDGLPPCVSGVPGLASAMPGKVSLSSVTTTRHDAASELTAVDPVFGRVFRRFVIGVAE